MRYIAPNTLFPSYELRGADLIIGEMDELRLSNVRKLFADREFDRETETKLEVDDGGASGGGGRDRWGNIGRNRRWD